MGKAGEKILEGLNEALDHARTISDIAGGLSPAQREILLRWHREAGAYALSSDYDGRAAACDIRRLPAGLYTRRMGGSQHYVYRLLPLGEQVRAFLLTQEKERVQP